MKKYALLILCLSQFFTYAQSIEPIGYYIDENQNEINNYIDLDYEPSKSLSKSINSLYEYLPGFYIDNEGIRHDGEIMLVMNFNNKFLFKSSSKEKRGKKINASQVKILEVGMDEYYSLGKFQYKTKLGTIAQKEKAFIGKSIVGDSISLHTYTNSHKDYHFLVSDKYFVSLPNKKRAFTKEVPKYFEDYPQLQKKLIDNEYDFADIKNIVTLYDNYIKLKNSTPTYYTKNWNVTKDSTKYKYYSKVINLEDSIWHVTSYDLLDRKVLEASYSSFVPLRKNGTFKWYYPNGNIRKETNYVNDETEGRVREYYSNGNLHWEYIENDIKKTFYEIKSKDGSLSIQGTGEEIFKDELRSLDIHRKYQDGKLVESYYFDDKENKIYQLTDRNSVLKKTYRLYLSDDFIYSDSAKIKLSEGLVLVSLIVKPSGKFTDINLVRGVEDEIDKKILEAFYKRAANDIFKAGKRGRTKIHQELVISIRFNIDKKYKRNNYYYHNWQMHHMMMNQHMMAPINPPSFH